MKERQYETMLAQLEGLTAGETNQMSVLANVSALMRDTMGERYFWVGFYLVDGEQLVLGPFQGSVACYRIGHGRGVCGTAWAQARTQVVTDVETFPGHIACSSLSRSEIVVPLIDGQGTVRGVLDIDSKELGQFDETDARYLERAAAIIARELW